MDNTTAPKENMINNGWKLELVTPEHSSPITVPLGKSEVDRVMVKCLTTLQSYFDGGLRNMTAKLLPTSKSCGPGYIIKIEDLSHHTVIPMSNPQRFFQIAA